MCWRRCSLDGDGFLDGVQDVVHVVALPQRRSRRRAMAATTTGSEGRWGRPRAPRGVAGTSAAAGASYARGCVAIGLVLVADVLVMVLIIRR